MRHNDKNHETCFFLIDHLGYSQVKELGNIETPVILTNTLSVPTAANALKTYTLALPGNEKVRSVNPVVGETNDGWLNALFAARTVTGREGHTIYALLIDEVLKIMKKHNSMGNK